MPVESTAPIASPSRASPWRGRRRFLSQWLLRAWPLLTAVGAVVVIQLMTTSGPPTYEATGSYVVRPRDGAPAAMIQATGVLNGTVRIDSTFAQIAESDLIVNRALASLPPAEAEAARDADVDATITRSANILSISARTGRPAIARELATAVGEETVRYIQDISDLYDLGVLDPPGEAVRSSEGPNLRELLAAGMVGLGAGIATRPLLSRRRGRQLALAPRLDTGMENEGYTRLRLREERGRTDTTGAPFHLLALQPDVPVQGGDVGSMARVLLDALGEVDHVGYLRDARPRTFVAILPNRSDHELELLAADIRRVAVERLRPRYGPLVDAAVWRCSYGGGAFHGDPEAIMVAEALS